HHQHIARDAEVFHRARQREGVRRDDADVRLHIDKALRIELLRIDDGAVDVGEDLEFARAAHVIAIAGGAIGDDALAVGLAHLARLKRFDHALGGGHAADPVVGLDAHEPLSTTTPGKAPLRSRGLPASTPAVRRAKSRYARARGVSGADTTVGLPASDSARMRASSGSLPSSATPPSAASASPPPAPKIASSWPHWLHTCVAMFSTTPSTAMPTLANITRPLRASATASSCGVVTITAPATGTFCASVSCRSPVPGGRSNTR